METEGLNIRQVESPSCQVYELITHPDAKNQHVVILSGNEGAPTKHFVVYNYITDGDGFGRSVYCGSKTYKTYKGALKKAAQHLAR